MTEMMSFRRSQTNTRSYCLYSAW